MGLNETHFDQVAGALVDTLTELHVNQAEIDEAVSIVGPLRAVFVQGAAEAQQPVGLLGTISSLPRDSPEVREVVDQLAALQKDLDVPIQAPLLERIGGEAALHAAVEIFYAKLLSIEALQPFFAGIDVNRLKKHQFGFMKLAFTEIPSDMDVAGFIKVRTVLFSLS